MLPAHVSELNIAEWGTRPLVQEQGPQSSFLLQYCGAVIKFILLFQSMLTESLCPCSTGIALTSQRAYQAVDQALRNLHKTFHPDPIFEQVCVLPSAWFSIAFPSSCVFLCVRPNQARNESENKGMLLIIAVSGWSSRKPWGWS